MLDQVINIKKISTEIQSDVNEDIGMLTQMSSATTAASSRVSRARKFAHDAVRRISNFQNFQNFQNYGVLLYIVMLRTWLSVVFVLAYYGSPKRRNGARILVAICMFLYGAAYFTIL